MMPRKEKKKKKKNRRHSGQWNPTRERKGQKKCHLRARRKKPESKKMPFPLPVKQEKREEKQRMSPKKARKEGPEQLEHRKTVPKEHLQVNPAMDPDGYIQQTKDFKGGASSGK